MQQSNYSLLSKSLCGKSSLCPAWLLDYVIGSSRGRCQVQWFPHFASDLQLKTRTRYGSPEARLMFEANFPNPTSRKMIGNRYAGVSRVSGALTLLIALAALSVVTAQVTSTATLRGIIRDQQGALVRGE